MYRTDFYHFRLLFIAGFADYVLFKYLSFICDDVICLFLEERLSYFIVLCLVLSIIARYCLRETLYTEFLNVNRDNLWLLGDVCHADQSITFFLLWLIYVWTLVIYLAYIGYKADRRLWAPYLAGIDSGQMCVSCRPSDRPLGSNSELCGYCGLSVTLPI